MIFQDKKDEAKKDEAKKDEAKKDEAKKDEAKKDEAKKDEAKKDESSAAEKTAPVTPKGTTTVTKEVGFLESLQSNWSPWALGLGAIVLVYFLYRYFLVKPGEQKS